MIYFIIAIIMAFIIKFLYDKYMLEEGVKTQGGIKSKYNILITSLTSGYNPIYQEHRDHLMINIETEFGTYAYMLLPAFNKLIVEVNYLGENNKQFENKWTFDLRKYDQRLMAKTIELYIDGINESVSDLPYLSNTEALLDLETVENSNLTEDAIKNDKDMINQIIGLPLLNKKKVWFEIYTISNSEEKSKILGTWNQVKHNNPYSDEINLLFEQNKDKRFFDPPTSLDWQKNVNSIHSSIMKKKHYEGIEEILLQSIEKISIESEIDRLLFISLALIDKFNMIYLELLESAKQNWTKLNNKMPCPYFIILTKTQIDILLLKNKDEEALNLAESTFNLINVEDYKDDFIWLKYQFVSTIYNILQLKSYNCGYSIEELNQLKETFSDNAFIDDFNNKMLGGEY